jgi:HEAT repeat protein
MNKLLVGAALLMGSAEFAWGQDTQWVETRFHRVHLRNGNVIDGQMVANTDKAVTLSIRGGDLDIRKDQVDRIELVKMRSLLEKPKPVMTALAAPSKMKKGKPVPTIDAVVRAKVDQNLSLFTNASPTLRDQLTRELAQRPGTAAYLVSKMEDVQDDVLPYVGRAIWGLQEEEAYPYILACMDSDRPGVVAQALILSGRWEGETAAMHVRRFLSDPRPRVRAAAIEALRQAGDVRSLPEIAQLLRSEDDAVRAMAINASLEMGLKFGKMEIVAGSLVNAIDRARGAVLGDLLEAAGRSRYAGMVDSLVDHLRDSEVSIRQRAAAGLVLNGSAAASRAVTQRLSVEESVEVRIQLVRAVAQMKSVEAIDPLIYMLRDKDEDLTAECLRALKLITKQDNGNRYENWINWWEQVRRGN